MLPLMRGRDDRDRTQLSFDSFTAGKDRNCEPRVISALPSLSLSHEFRTPLNAIIGFTGTLLMRLPGPINADQENQLQIIQTSARQLLSLIDGMERDCTAPSDSYFEPEPVSIAGNTQNREKHVRRPRILVIDDHVASRKLMTCLLNFFNYEPLMAADGESGLALARQEVPDLILCDVQMPKFSGFAVARSLKSDPVLKHIPLVAMTAFLPNELQPGGTTHAFDYFLRKPIQSESLASQLDLFLQGSVPAHSGPIGKRA